MKGKEYTFKNFDKILKKNGWVALNQKGTSHVVYRKDGKHMSVPSRKMINRMLTRRLIKENNIEV